MTFDSGETFGFSAEELCAFHIDEGKYFCEETWAEVYHRILCERAKGKVMSFVTFSRKTGGQVFDRVVSLGFSEAVAESLVTELAEKGYIDDLSYCR